MVFLHTRQLFKFWARSKIFKIKTELSECPRERICFDFAPSVQLLFTMTQPRALAGTTDPWIFFQKNVMCKNGFYITYFVFDNKNQRLTALSSDWLRLSALHISNWPAIRTECFFSSRRWFHEKYNWWINDDKRLQPTS